MTEVPPHDYSGTLHVRIPKPLQSAFVHVLHLYKLHQSDVLRSLVLSWTRDMSKLYELSCPPPSKPQ